MPIPTNCLDITDEAVRCYQLMPILARQNVLHYMINTGASMKEAVEYVELAATKVYNEAFKRDSA